MDLFVDLKVPAVGGSQWTTAERQREEKSLCGNDLQTLLDFCGSPQNDAVERVKGIEPSYEAWEAAVLPLNYTRSGVVPRRRAGAEPTIIARLFLDSRGIFVLPAAPSGSLGINASPI